MQVFKEIMVTDLEDLATDKLMDGWMRSKSSTAIAEVIEIYFSARHCPLIRFLKLLGVINGNKRHIETWADFENNVSLTKKNTTKY